MCDEMKLMTPCQIGHPAHPYGNATPIVTYYNIDLHVHTQIHPTILGMREGKKNKKKQMLFSFHISPTIKNKLGADTYR